MYNALTLTEAEDKYNALVRKFKEFVEGKKDSANERYIFNNRDQKEGETFLYFLTNITSQAGKYGFDHLKNNMTHDCIVSGIWSERTKVMLRDLARLGPEHRNKNFFLND